MRHLLRSTTHLIFLALAPALFADSVTTSVYCQGLNSNVTDPSACSLSGTFSDLGFPQHWDASASIASSYTFTPTTFSTTGAGIASALDTHGNIPYSQGNSSISVDIDTVGAVRSGFVLISWDAVATKGGGDGGADANYSFPASNFGAGNCPPPGPGSCNYSFLEPFTLGTAFDFTEMMSVGAETSSVGDTATISASLSLKFFEADGTTPVDIEEVATPTPEPQSLTLLTLSLSLLGLHLLTRKLKIWRDMHQLLRRLLLHNGRSQTPPLDLRQMILAG
jgi:hypothetical protein